MFRDLTKESLKKKYPNIIKCDINIGNGWLWMVDKFITAPKVLELEDKFNITRIESEYGSLLIQTNVVTPDDSDEISKLISRYSRMSMNFCEVCGAEGFLYCKSFEDNKNNYKTLCDRHKGEYSYMVTHIK